MIQIESYENETCDYSFLGTSLLKYSCENKMPADSSTQTQETDCFGNIKMRVSSLVNQRVKKMYK